MHTTTGVGAVHCQHRFDAHIHNLALCSTGVLVQSGTSMMQLHLVRHCSNKQTSCQAKPSAAKPSQLITGSGDVMSSQLFGETATAAEDIICPLRCSLASPKEKHAVTTVPPMIKQHACSVALHTCSENNSMPNHTIRQQIVLVKPMVGRACTRNHNQRLAQWSNNSQKQNQVATPRSRWQRGAQACRRSAGSCRPC